MRRLYRPRWGLLLVLCVFVASSRAWAQTEPEMDAPATEADALLREGITFAAEPGALYLPVREVGEAFGWTVQWEAESQTPLLHGLPLPAESARRLVDGTVLIAVRDLERWEVRVTWDAAASVARLTCADTALWVRRGEKRVAINLAEQRMRAWQGGRLVLETPVSSGRRGFRTPTGAFTLGPYKSRMHYSTLYQDAPMPYSVQIIGNVFIHGYHSVPSYPASHGCVRVPLSGGNPAAWFFAWAEVGTPVTVAYAWPESPAGDETPAATSPR